MIKQYFIRELRSLLKTKYISVLKITGLIIGLWVFMAAGYYILHETSFDYFQDSAENKFSMDGYYPFGEIFFQTPLPYVLCESLSERYPEVIKNTSFRGETAAIYLKKDDILIKSKYSEIGFVEKSFFDFFKFHFIAGNAEESFNAANPLIISEDVARKNFGGVDVIGTPVSVVVDDQEFNFTITGIIKEPASNSNVNFRWIGSLSNLMQAQGKNNYKSDWNYLCKNFVELVPGTDRSEFAAKLSNEYFRLGKLEQTPKVLMTGLCQLHFNKHLRILTTLGILILLISIINFVLLSTFEKTQQMLYWGIERVSGAKKIHLWLKNSTSAIIYSILAFVLTLLLFKLTLPYFPDFVGSDVAFNAILDTKKIIIGVLLCLLSVILLSSLINQWITGDLKPIDILQKKLSKGKTGKILFNSLLTFQLVAFIALISASLLIHKQLSFMQESDMGFNKESLISMNISPKDVHSYKIFKDELLKNSNIINIGSANSIPLPGLRSIYGEVITDSMGNQHFKQTEYIYVDSDYFKTLEISFAQGNNFKEDALNQCIVNEKLIKDRGLNDPINESIEFGGNKYRICGVVKDYHSNSMQMRIMPFVAHYNPDKITKVLVRFSGNPSETVNLMKKATKKYLPYTVFEFEFFDQHIKAAYQSEIRFSNIINLLTMLSILIAVLGLLGVSYFSSQLRIKEIGIRKVNGAKISEVLIMLNADFVKWVGIGFIIATPVAFYAMNKWLENFVYKTSISLWIFVLSGFLALVIALLTVSLQSWKSATRNPVEALRYE